MRLGYFLSCEEYTPAELLDQARHAADAGFGALWISDHYHPWLGTQEHFEQAVQIVPPEAMKMPHGPDPQPYLDTIDTYRQAGYDELYIAAVGPHHQQLIDMFAKDILPSINATRQ